MPWPGCCFSCPYEGPLFPACWELVLGAGTPSPDGTQYIWPSPPCRPWASLRAVGPHHPRKRTKRITTAAHEACTLPPRPLHVLPCSLSVLRDALLRSLPSSPTFVSASATPLVHLHPSRRTRFAVDTSPAPLPALDLCCCLLLAQSRGAAVQVSSYLPRHRATTTAVHVNQPNLIYLPTSRQIRVLIAASLPNISACRCRPSRFLLAPSWPLAHLDTALRVRHRPAVTPARAAFFSANFPRRSVFILTPF